MRESEIAELGYAMEALMDNKLVPIVRQDAPPVKMGPSGKAVCALVVLVLSGVLMAGWALDNCSGRVKGINVEVVEP
jgi:hypothetical protein